MALILLTGGGTGGHVYPNIALVPALERLGYDVEYGGAEGDAAEARIARLYGLDYRGVPCVKLVRSAKPYALRNNISIPRILARGTAAAAEILKNDKPALVFSKGGFAALPYVLAAVKTGIPVICHESDSTLGLSNRIARLKGAKVLTAFPDVGFGEFVGMPVREELMCRDRLKSRAALGIPSGEKVLLAVGGSSGADALNKALTTVLPSLTKICTVIHVTGKGKGGGTPVSSPRYKTMEYAEDMGSLYAACDAVLSRAGATAVAEISALGKRAVFVPLPKGVSRGDQIPNARLAESYGAFVLPQDENLVHKLYPAVKKAFDAPPMRRISDDANGKIARLIDDTIRRGVKCKDKKR